MAINTIKNKRVFFFTNIFVIFLTLTFFVGILCLPSLAKQESPLSLPKNEGSKNFDLEIDQINNKGIDAYFKGNFKKAVLFFRKALNLAKQFRDPGQGTLYFNLGLSFHKLKEHKNAIEQLYSARRFARGNKKILDSELLKLYECGLNPNVPCEKKVPLSLNIEGSH